MSASWSAWSVCQRRCSNSSSLAIGVSKTATNVLKPEMLRGIPRHLRVSHDPVIAVPHG
ncbi:MAG: hypothetical protein U0270_42665 [Labilithrix sp.]